MLVALAVSLPATSTAQGSDQWNGNVPSDGTVVEVALPAGSYSLVATGTFQYASGGNAPSDASRAYHSTFGECWDPPGNNLDLLVNDISAWSPACDPVDHKYNHAPLIECVSSCTIRLRILDDLYSDNSGSISVAITRAPENDNIPDDIESEACGRPFVRTLLATAAPNLGDCVTEADYRPPSQFGGVNRADTVEVGSDVDGDGFPDTVTITRSRTVIRPFDADTIHDEPGPPLIFNVDPDDHDPETPMWSQMELPVMVVTNAEFGDDSDGDGFPATLRLTFGRVTIHRNATELTTIEYSVVEYPVDPDDTDDSVPITNTVGPIRVPTSAHGTDRDGDRLPGTITIAYTDYTIDRTATPPLSSTPSGPESYTVDPDDGTRGAGSITYDPFDGDRDDIPDAIEPILCQIQNDNRPEDGICPTPDKDDYQPYIAPPNPWNRN